MTVQGFPRAYVSLYSPRGEILSYPDAAVVYDADHVSKKYVRENSICFAKPAR